jgi:tetratricopeptide (TPR) repeat protein
VKLCVLTALRYFDLAMNNNNSVKRDCDESLRLAPGNTKCYYRKAKALEGLKQYDEAVQCCIEGLALTPDSKVLLSHLFIKRSLAL